MPFLFFSLTLLFLQHLYRSSHSNHWNTTLTIWFITSHFASISCEENLMSLGEINVGEQTQQCDIFLFITREKARVRKKDLVQMEINVAVRLKFPHPPSWQEAADTGVSGVHGNVICKRLLAAMATLSWVSLSNRAMESLVGSAISAGTIPRGFSVPKPLAWPNLYLETWECSLSRPWYRFTSNFPPLSRDDNKQGI